jgi:hypothetical protein
MKRFLFDEKSVEFKQVKKLKNQKISPILRRRIWEVYIGFGVKVTNCPLCDFNEIKNFDQNSGFQACHIVADNFLEEGNLNVFYLFPGCQACNVECSDLCLFDFLYNRFRFKQLANMIKSVCKLFKVQTADSFSDFETTYCNILDNLYGFKRFPAGGGITCRKSIYEYARSIEILEVNKTLAKLYKDVEEMSKYLKVVCETEIKPEKLLVSESIFIKEQEEKKK